jgi:hypothetical protein
MRSPAAVLVSDPDHTEDIGLKGRIPTVPAQEFAKDAGADKNFDPAATPREEAQAVATKDRRRGNTVGARTYWVCIRSTALSPSPAKRPAIAYQTAYHVAQETFAAYC